MSLHGPLSSEHRSPTAELRDSPVVLHPVVSTWSASSLTVPSRGFRYGERASPRAAAVSSCIMVTVSPIDVGT